MERKSLISIFLLIFTLNLWSTTSATAQETDTDEKLTAVIGQIDNADYPDITIYVNVTDEEGQPVATLTEADFAITEDGKNVTITDFAGISESRPVDIVFVFDTTGSMGDEIDGVKETAIEFAQKLRENNRDFRLGLISYGDIVVEQFNEDGTLTADEEEFKGWVSSLEAEGGGRDPENSYEALQTAANMDFREDAQIVFLLITDAPPHHYGDSLEIVDWQTIAEFDDPDITLDRTLEILGEDAISVYAITLNDPEFVELADETGGDFHDLDRNPDFTGIIDEIGQVLANQYKITYESSRPTPDGTRRGVAVTVGTGINQTTTTAEYLEEHLLNIHSDWLIGLLFSVPLLLALFIPLGLQRRKTNAAQLSAPMTSPLAPSSSQSPLPPYHPPPPTAVTTCPHCQQPVPNNAKFCRSCGQNLQTPPPANLSPPTCANCHQPLAVGVKFCRQCGHPVG